jgi:hypothetical protein
MWAGFDSYEEGKVNGSQDQLYLSGGGGGEILAPSLDIISCFINFIEHPAGT